MDFATPVIPEEMLLRVDSSLSMSPFVAMSATVWISLLIAAMSVDMVGVECKLELQVLTFD